jgi:hypothetical protein
MGLKLTLLSWWTPNFVVNRMLDQVSALTAAALESLPVSLPSNVYDIAHSSAVQDSGTVAEKRLAMAKQHVRLVEALVFALGQDAALNLGREALFEVGTRLGGDVRAMLGVGDSPGDLIRAAKVLYRVLGIEFTVQWTVDETATLFVNRCALSKEYSQLTCMVLSATDEGVMQGLNPNARMQFKERITDGCPKCKADIQFVGGMLKK